MTFNYGSFGYNFNGKWRMIMDGLRGLRHSEIHRFRGLRRYSQNDSCHGLLRFSRYDSYRGLRRFSQDDDYPRTSWSSPLRDSSVSRPSPLLSE
jgi:hypothetical protein